jgi:hypothetical protein
MEIIMPPSFLKMLSVEENPSIPQTRFDMVLALPKHSSKAKVAVVRMMEADLQNERLIVFCQYPLMQIFLETLAVLLNIEVSIKLACYLSVSSYPFLTVFFSNFKQYPYMQKIMSPKDSINAMSFVTQIVELDYLSLCLP